jgi:hypothetical protein
MRPGITIEDCSAYVQHGLDHRREDKVRGLDQLADACIVLATTDGPDKQSVGSERATNVVLDVDQLALRKFSIGQERAHLPHLDILNMHGAEPVQPHHLCIPRASFRSVLLRIVDSDTRM